MPETIPACIHAEPYPDYVTKNRRGRYYKGKHYIWCKCNGCNVIFLGVFWPTTEEGKLGN